MNDGNFKWYLKDLEIHSYYDLEATNIVILFELVSIFMK